MLTLAIGSMMAFAVKDAVAWTTVSVNATCDKYVGTMNQMSVGFNQYSVVFNLSGFSYAVQIPNNPPSSHNAITEDLTGKTQVGPSDYGNKNAWFKNGMGPVILTIPADGKKRVWKFGYEYKTPILIVLDPNTPACTPPPPPTPPTGPTPPVTPPLIVTAPGFPVVPKPTVTGRCTRAGYNSEISVTPAVNAKSVTYIYGNGKRKTINKAPFVLKLRHRRKPVGVVPVVTMNNDKVVVLKTIRTNVCRKTTKRTPNPPYTG